MGLEGENRQAKKKLIKKALIPLPPTGFASLYCAEAGVVKIKAAPKPAERSVSLFAISRRARFCKEVQWRCVTSRASQVGGRPVETPICKGMSPENKRLIEFLNSQKLVSRCFLTCVRKGVNLPESPDTVGFQAL